MSIRQKLLNDLGDAMLYMGEANPTTPCPGCGKHSIQDCNFGEYDYWGDFDCTHEDAGKIECPCELTYCDICQGDGR